MKILITIAAIALVIGVVNAAWAAEITTAARPTPAMLDPDWAVLLNS